MFMKSHVKMLIAAVINFSACMYLSDNQLLSLQIHVHCSNSIIMYVAYIDVVYMQLVRVAAHLKMITVSLGGSYPWIR